MNSAELQCAFASGGYNNNNRYTHSFFDFLSIYLACRPTATFNMSSPFTAFCIHTALQENFTPFMLPFKTQHSTSVLSHIGMQFLTHNNVTI